MLPIELTGNILPTDV